MLASCRRTLELRQARARAEQRDRLDQEIAYLEVWVPALYGTGRVLLSGRVAYGSGTEKLIMSISSPFYLLSRLMRGHPGLAALCQERDFNGGVTIAPPG